MPDEAWESGKIEEEVRVREDTMTGWNSISAQPTTLYKYCMRI